MHSIDDRPNPPGAIAAIARLSQIGNQTASAAVLEKTWAGVKVWSFCRVKQISETDH